MIKIKHAHRDTPKRFPAACLIVLNILLIFVGFVGCTSPPPTTTPTPSTPDDTALPSTATLTPSPLPQPKPSPTPTEPLSLLGIEPDDLRGVSIDFWHVWTRNAGKQIQELVIEFNVTNPYGIRVQTQHQGGYADLGRKLDQAISSGEIPNLVVGFNNQILSWDAHTGLIVDLELYLDDPVWGIPSEQRSDMPALLWEMDVVDGKRFGIPAQRSAQVLFYNLSWAQELGYTDPPTSPEQFKEQACAATQFNLTDNEVSNDGTGGWVVDSTTATVTSWIYSFGGQISTSDGYQFNNPETEAAFSFWKELYDDGCAYISKNRYPNPDFATRKALFISSSLAGIPFQESAFQDAENFDSWTAIPFPSPLEVPVIDIFGPSFAMVESTKEEQLATWLLLKWISTPENQARWVKASGYLPNHLSALVDLEGYMVDHPQWAAVVDLLDFGRIEPKKHSWGAIRWALSDAAEQVIRLNLKPEQISSLLEQLDSTAAELHVQGR